MLLIHVPRLTNRLGYTLNVLLQNILSIDYEITIDRDHYQQYAGPKMSYGSQPIDESPFLRACGLVFETSLTQQKVEHLVLDDGTHALFPVPQPSALPFDPVAASFYTLSRYEEYLPFRADQHDRFSSETSIATQYGYLHQAVVDRWAGMILKTLQKAYPQEGFSPRAPQQVLTIDVDAAYCYRHKGILRTLRGYLRDATIFHNPEALKQRTLCLLHKQHDPYDTYDYILQTVEGHIRPTFFILVGDYSAYDKPIPYTNRHFRQLLQHINDYAPIGVHPSYYSHLSTPTIQKETERLATILHRTITHSRFHHLRLRLPDSYNNLIEAGLTDDFSMAYTDTPGYRAGTGTPFPFFDLKTNQEQPLTIHPFILSDSYPTLSRQQVLEHYTTLLQETQRNGGTLTLLLHNQNLAETTENQPTRQLLEQITKNA